MNWKERAQSLRPFLIPALSAFVLSVIGIHWGISERFHEDENNLQRLTLMMISGRFEEGLYLLYGNLTQIWYALVIWPSLFLRNTPYTAIVLSRLSSAFLAALLPLFLGLSARILWNDKAARVTAWCAALTPSVIAFGHWGTVDMPQLFGLCAALYTALRLIKVRNPRDFFLCGFVCGLATAIKFQGWLMVLPACLIAASFIPISYLFLGCAAGFFAGMPFLWMNPEAALKWWTFHGLVYSRGMIGDTALLKNAANLFELMGPILGIISVLGLIFSFKEKNRWLLLSLWLPFYLSTASWKYAPQRYSLALAPAFILYASYFLSRAKPAMVKTVLAFCALFILWMDLGFLLDSRFTAARWMTANLPELSTIEMTPYTPFVPKPLRYWSRYTPPRDPLVLKPIPSWLIAKVKEIAPEEMELADQEKRGIPEPDAENFTQAALARRQSEFVVLTDLYVDRYRYERYAQANPARASYYLSLWDGLMPGYSLIQRFKFFPTAWWAPKPEFVDPEIRIYAKTKSN